MGIECRSYSSSLHISWPTLKYPEPALAVFNVNFHKETRNNETSERPSQLIEISCLILQQRPGHSVDREQRFRVGQLTSLIDGCV